MTATLQATGLVALAERIELWPIDRLRPYERNPRTHSEVQPATAGCSRRASSASPEVPVIRFEHLSEAQKRAYTLADNQIALQAGRDDALLAEELAWLRNERFDLDLIGFDAFIAAYNATATPFQWRKAKVHPKGLAPRITDLC